MVEKKKYGSGLIEVSDIDKINLDDNYVPNQDEEYMCDNHLRYFLNLLVKQQMHYENECTGVVSDLQNYELANSDEQDRAVNELAAEISIRTGEMYYEALEQLKLAIKRVYNHEYGYCLETGDEIGLKRLMVNPMATLCVQAQEMKERRQKLQSRNSFK